MIFKLIYYFCILQCQNENRRNFTVILERNNVTDFSILADFDESENNTVSVYLWDKYFPKPFFYLINQDELLKLTSIEDKNTLFMAKIDYKNEIINTIEINEAYDEGSVNDFDFAIICKNANIDSIRNSLIYKLKVESIRPLYVELAKFFVRYSNEIRNYRLLVENTIKNHKAFTNIWKAESLSIEVTNAVIKCLALLNVPSRSKLEFVSPKKYYADKFAEIESLIGESLKDCGLDLYVRQKIGTLHKSETDTFSKIANESLEYIMCDRKKEECVIIFNQIADKIEILEDFWSSVVQKNKINKEITLDCDTKKVKTFVDKYSDFLYEYCNVMENFDEIYLTDYVVSIVSKDNPAEKILEKIYTDKLIARELKKYLNDSYDDLTSFKIFSQTDYFKKDLSKNILNNLICLIGSRSENPIKLRIDAKITSMDIKIIEHQKKRIDSELKDTKLKNGLNDLLRFYKTWFEILYDPYEERTLSMDDLVNGKKIGGNFFMRTLRYVRDFFMKYLFINLFILVIGIPILIRLIFKRNNHREWTFSEDEVD